MLFKQIRPSTFLRSYISRYMISENHLPETYKVIPKPSIVMGIQYKGEIAIEENNHKRKLTASGITGLCDTCKTFTGVAETGSVLIEFTPHGAAKFFEFPVNIIFGSSLSLEELTHRQLAAELQERISCAAGNNDRIRIVEEFFLSRMDKGKADILVEEAIRQIQNANGNISMKVLADSLCISQRQFEKRFLRVVGSSPKKFSSLVRFNGLLNRQHSFTSLTSLALDAGYFDQAHFIKDFKSYLGLTPEQFFADASLRSTFR